MHARTHASLLRCLVAHHIPEVFAERGAAQRRHLLPHRLDPARHLDVELVLVHAQQLAEPAGGVLELAGDEVVGVREEPKSTHNGISQHITG